MSVRSFKDEAGQEWVLRIDTHLHGALRDKLGVEILEIIDEEAALVEALLGDLQMLSKVLWVLCEEQAIERDVSNREFARQLAGDCLQDAGIALLWAIHDFFPGPQKRAIMEATIQKGLDLQELTEKELAAVLEKFRKMDLQSLRRKRTKSSSKTARSQASTRKKRASAGGK